MKLTISKINELIAGKTIGAALAVLGELTFSPEYQGDEIPELAYEAAELHKKFMQQAQWLAREAEQTIGRLNYTASLDRVAMYTGISTCGVLQGQGPAFDVAAVLYATAEQKVRRAIESLAHAERKVAHAAKMEQAASDYPGIFRALQLTTMLSRIARAASMTETDAAVALNVLAEAGVVAIDKSKSGKFTLYNLIREVR